jgi:hypothetical protein
MELKKIVKFDRIIEFKSTKENYKKESNNIKRNTVRVVSFNEDEDIKAYIKNIKFIGIVYNCKRMVRKLTDITRFESHELIIYIFSW